MAPCSEGFSPGYPVFLPSQKPTFPNSNSSWERVDEEPLRRYSTANSHLFHLFISFIYFTVYLISCLFLDGVLSEATNSLQRVSREYEKNVKAAHLFCSSEFLKRSRDRRDRGMARLLGRLKERACLCLVPAIFVSWIAEKQRQSAGTDKSRLCSDCSGTRVLPLEQENTFCTVHRFLLGYQHWIEPGTGLRA